MSYYRRSDTINDLKEKLASLAENETIGFIWQSHDDSKTIFKITKFEIQPDGLMLFLDKAITLDPAKDVYFKTDDNEVIFKLSNSDLTTAGSLLYCRYPDLTLNKDKRKKNRFIVPANKKLYFTIQKIGFNAEQIISCRIEDISAEGFRVSANIGQKDLIDETSLYIIKSFNSTKTSQDIFCRVRFKDVKGSSLTVGFEAKNETSIQGLEDIKNQIIKICD